jgi:hypothetical protein
MNSIGEAVKPAFKSTLILFVKPNRTKVMAVTMRIPMTKIQEFWKILTATISKLFHFERSELVPSIRWPRCVKRGP